jgi:hypothetical protein
MVAESMITAEEQHELLTGRPWPVGVRDLGSRHYEAVAEWSSSLPVSGSENFTADQHAALRAQAVTEAESTLADELGMAEAEIKRQFGADALLEAKVERERGRVLIRYYAIACVGADLKAVSGVGSTVWEAVDDLRNSAAELPAVAAVA